MLIFFLVFLILTFYVCICLLTLMSPFIVLESVCLNHFLFYSILISESGHIGTIIIHSLLFSTPFLTFFCTLTPLSISSSQVSIPAISTEGPTPRYRYDVPSFTSRELFSHSLGS